VVVCFLKIITPYIADNTKLLSKTNYEYFQSLLGIMLGKSALMFDINLV